jgi:hypothetical protein
VNDDEFTYEPQPITFRIGRREITLRGCINSVDLSQESPYAEYGLFGSGVSGLLERSASIKLSNVTMEERWVHDDPHVVALDRHGKKNRCQCTCSRCFIKAPTETAIPCICPDCKCNGGGEDG